MSSQMARLPCAYLLIFNCFTFISINGRAQDSFSSCEVELMVKRGTTWRAVPQQRLKVKCPVRHCGESLNVTWCKYLDTGKCEQVSYTENVTIKQVTKPGEGELVSLLTFKRISSHDDGLYQCHTKGYKYEVISHTINISVSDSNQGIENSDYNADELSTVAEDEDASVLPYFFICGSIAFLVAVLTVLTWKRFYGSKQILINNHTKGQCQYVRGYSGQLCVEDTAVACTLSVACKLDFDRTELRLGQVKAGATGRLHIFNCDEMSNRMIPDLPKGSVSSTLFLQTHCSSLNENPSSSAAKIPTSQPPLATRKKPAVANTADESQAPVYAVIKHR